MESSECYIFHITDWQTEKGHANLPERVVNMRQRLACVSDQTKPFIVISGKRQIFPHFLWASCCTNHCLLLYYLYPHLLNVLNQQSAKQTILYLAPLQVFILPFNLFLSACWQRTTDLSSVLLFIICLTTALASRLLWASAEPWWAAGCMLTLAHLQAHVERVASRLHHVSCSASIIELRAPSKKKGHSQQFLGQAALFSYLGKSWGFGPRPAECSLPARAHTQTPSRSETLSRGISCRSPRNEALGAHLMGFAWL